MEQYIQQLRKDFETGKLIMDCIMPSAYEWLCNSGQIGSAEWVNYWIEATQYRLKQQEANPKKLSELVEGFPVGLAEKAQIERNRKIDIAKKMAVYEYIRNQFKLIENEGTTAATNNGQ